MSEDRLVAVEEKLAHQEHAVHELHEVVYAQQRQIEKLELRCGQLGNRVAALSEQLQGQSDEAGQKPPHY